MSHAVGLLASLEIGEAGPIQATPGAVGWLLADLSTSSITWQAQAPFVISDLWYCCSVERRQKISCRGFLADLPIVGPQRRP